MPHSLRSRIKKFHHQGLLSNKDRDRILNALDYEWIPVKERLPGKDAKYLVTRDGSLGLSIVDIASWSNLERKNNGFYKANMVTAWMPLPEPYREDGE